MKKTLVAISVAAFLGTAGAALAEEAKGKIQAVDQIQTESAITRAGARGDNPVAGR